MCTFTTWGDVNSQSLQWGCKGRIPRVCSFSLPFPHLFSFSVGLWRRVARAGLAALGEGTQGLCRHRGEASLGGRAASSFAAQGLMH